MLPDCQPIEIPNKPNKIEFPFSIELLVQCFKRVRLRKEHENLNGDNPELLSIFGTFYNNFINVKLDESLFMRYKFDKIIKLPFTKETPKVENKELVDLFKAFIRDTGNRELKKQLDSLLNKLLSEKSKEFSYEDTHEDIRKIATKAFINLYFGYTEEDINKLIQEKVYKTGSTKNKLKNLLGDDPKASSPVVKENEKIQAKLPDDVILFYLVSLPRLEDFG